MIPEPTEASIRIARDTVSRDPIFKTAADIHGRAIESAIYRMANSEVARCYLRLVAAREPDDGKLREALEAIVARAPERDVKWSGMTARDIAIYALGASRNQGR